MLSNLEEIRDSALSAIFIKMQCQSRRVLVHVKYQTKIAEKKALQSMQRNIKLYYACRVRNTFTPLIYAEKHQTLLRLQGKNTFTPSYYLDKCQTLLRLQGKTRDNSASTAIYTVDRMQYTVRVKCNRELRCDIVNSRIFQPYLSI